VTTAAAVALAATALGAALAYAVSTRRVESPAPARAIPPDAVLLSPDSGPQDVHFGWERSPFGDATMHLVLVLTAIPPGKDLPLDGRPWPEVAGGWPVAGVRVRMQIKEPADAPLVGSRPILPWFKPLPGCTMDPDEPAEMPQSAYVTTDAAGRAAVEFFSTSCRVTAEAEFPAAAGGTVVRRGSITLNRRRGE